MFCFLSEDKNIEAFKKVLLLNFLVSYNSFQKDVKKFIKTNLGI